MITLPEFGNIPMTGHFIGGRPIGESPRDGVIDPYQRLHGYEELHVLDGSAISANLGVNPSLTITAQAERTVAMWPNKGEVDPHHSVPTTNASPRSNQDIPLSRPQPLAGYGCRSRRCELRTRGRR